MNFAKYYPQKRSPANTPAWALKSLEMGQERYTKAGERMSVPQQ
jgi:hypothetical protein